MMIDPELKISDFDFTLPAALIAQEPAHPRDSARLLHVGATLGDHIIRDLPQLLQPGDLLVSNDTRVIPARLYGQRGAARIEFLLHQHQQDGQWHAFARPAKRLRPGDTVICADDLVARIVAKLPDGQVVIDFDMPHAELLAALERYGQMPLPPYIRRANGNRPTDADDYQTIFARHHGSIAAPTAGLHFTPDLLAALDARGVQRTTVTLHVGAGTFLPVKAERLADHKMHQEWGQVDAATVDAIAATRARGGRIVAVGTTSLRLLETAARGGALKPWCGHTDIFITPGFTFNIADLLLTNFHLPQSTLFVLVCAFAGTARMRAAYGHAIANGYRFYSYGDGSLLERAIK